MEGDKNKKDESRGFAGLSSLVSDIGILPPPATKKKTTNTTDASLNLAPSMPQMAQSELRQHQTYQEPTKPSSGLSKMWMFAVTATVFIVFLLTNIFNKDTTTHLHNDSSLSQSTALIDSPSVEPQEPSLPRESRPPIGQNTVLSTTEIRYCLAEDIRLEGAKAILNNHINSDIDRFNAMVGDYNSRCSSFLYRRGALEDARRDIEPYRRQLQADGKNRFYRSPLTSSMQTPASIRATPNATVHATQRMLNALGYKAGSADGLMGRGPRLAIISFQQDSGLTITGVVDQALLLQLKRALARSSDNSAANGAALKETPLRLVTTTLLTDSPSPSMNESNSSANSCIFGSNWHFNEGFRKIDNQCQALTVSAYALASVI